MKAVAEKEKKGRLDLNAEPYESVSKEEQELLNKDWKAFSRKRGYSEEDINEYERWRVLSGQSDNLKWAINDPWRRKPPFLDEYLYIRHIEHALELGKPVGPKILDQYQEVKQRYETRISSMGFDMETAKTTLQQDVVKNEVRPDEIW